MKTITECVVSDYFKKKEQCKGKLKVVPVCFGCGKEVSEQDRTVAMYSVGIYFKCDDCDERQVLSDISDHAITGN